MTDEAQSQPSPAAAPVTEPQTAVIPPPPVLEPEPPSGPSVTDKVAALIDERPEVGAGGALVGGIVLALILKRLGR